MISLCISYHPASRDVNIIYLPRDVNIIYHPVNNIYLPAKNFIALRWKLKTIGGTGSSARTEPGLVGGNYLGTGSTNCLSFHLSAIGLEPTFSVGLEPTFSFLQKNSTTTKILIFFFNLFPSEIYILITYNIFITIHI